MMQVYFGGVCVCVFFFFFFVVICVNVSVITFMYLTGDWSLFDFVDPPRHLALSVADHTLNEGDPGVLEMHLEQFLLPALPTDSAAYIAPLPLVPSGGVSSVEKKPTRIKVTGRKYMASGAAASSVGGTALTRGDTSTPVAMISPGPISKKRKTFVPPSLSAFEAVQAAYALPLGTSIGAQAENVTSTQLSYAGVVLPSSNVSSVTGPIPQVGATAAVSCAMPPPTPTTAVTVTAGPVSISLTSSVAPSSLFDSPLSIFSIADKETPAVHVTQEATSAGGAAANDAGGSSSGIADDGTRLVDDLYLPTISWDPNARDKRFQPQWKIAESSRLLFPPVIQRWIERAYPPAEVAYVEA
ncbi:hypothetical protein HanPI659440_Chr02g0088271 [Helianthus annuus]|nr:hypothetical protein HanPI659440_Chr02g0088271 [Helianthus annuus]